MLRVDWLSLSAGRFRLEDIRLRVHPGEYFVLMGPTGSGKSLLTKCICGLIQPDAGAILLDGRNITRLEPRRRRIGYVPQEACLFPHMDVAANITFSLRLKGMSRSASLDKVDGLLTALGLTELLERQTASLSGGERQKVAVARALANRPDLLILDEPVSAIDEAGRNDICAELKRVQRDLKVPTIHVCHAASEARLVADRIGAIRGGQIVQEWPKS